MKTILFPTDFSAVAHNAFEYALAFAERLEARIILLHSYHYASADEIYMPAEMIQALAMEKEEEALRRFEEYEKEVQLNRQKKVPVTHELRYGFAAEAVKEYAEEIKPYLVIMGTKGANNPGDKFLGSVTSHVIRNCKCPVLAIPDESSYKEVKKIAFATSFEKKDFSVIDYLLKFARTFDAEIHCVHIREKDENWTQLQLDFFESIYELEVKKDRLHFFVMNEEDIEEGLDKFISERNIDVLAMLTHKRNLFGRIFNPSLTRKMAMHTEVPLLAFHEKGC